MTDHRADIGEGPDADEAGHAKDEAEQLASEADAIDDNDPHKVEKLAKVGHNEDEAEAAEASE